MRIMVRAAAAIISPIFKSAFFPSRPPPEPLERRPSPLIAFGSITSLGEKQVTRVAALTVVSGVAASALLVSCGDSRESIRATQVAFMAERDYRMSTPPPHTVDKEATSEAVWAEQARERAKCGDKNPLRYNCNAVAINALARKVKAHVDNLNGGLVNRLNELYNRRFENPAGAFILASSREDFERKAAVIRSEHDAEGRRVFRWMQEIMQACNHVENKLDETKNLRSELADIWFPSETYDWVENALDKAEAWLSTTARQECRHGHGLYALAEERAEEHYIVNRPQGW